MYKERRILAVITARSGSKGIPNKNIKLMNGKTLIEYTIEAALGSKYLTKTIVSTDSEEYQKIALSFGAEVPFLRPSELSSDTAKSIDVIKHAINFFENKDEFFDYIMILQPTSPLRTSGDIDEAIKIIIEKDADSVMSMVKLEDFSIPKMKLIDEDGLILPLVIDEGAYSSRRQDEPDVYKRNCAIYLTKTELIKSGNLFGSKSYAYIMPVGRSVDINSLLDFEFAEFLLKIDKTV